MPQQPDLKPIPRDLRCPACSKRGLSHRPSDHEEQRYSREVPFLQFGEAIVLDGILARHLGKGSWRHEH
jgi:hypothetical protein